MGKLEKGDEQTETGRRQTRAAGKTREPDKCSEQSQGTQIWPKIHAVSRASHVATANGATQTGKHHFPLHGCCLAARSLGQRRERSPRTLNTDFFPLLDDSRQVSSFGLSQVRKSLPRQERKRCIVGKCFCWEGFLKVVHAHGEQKPRVLLTQVIHDLLFESFICFLAQYVIEPVVCGLFSVLISQNGFQENTACWDAVHRFFSLCSLASPAPLPYHT